jgi:hypothetical protein
MKTKDPFIFFITGASGSGKTTLYESLREDPDFSGVDFHDIDEDGVPPVGRGPWGLYRVEQLLYDATKAFDAGRSTVICGLTRPSQVIESVYFGRRYRVSFLLVRVKDEFIQERLKDRSEKHTADGTFDESFDKGRIALTIYENLRVQTVLGNAVSNLRYGYELEATTLSKQEMHDKAKQIINEAAYAKQGQ